MNIRVLNKLTVSGFLALSLVGWSGAAAFAEPAATAVEPEQVAQAGLAAPVQPQAEAPATNIGGEHFTQQDVYYTAPGETPTVWVEEPILIEQPAAAGVQPGVPVITQPVVIPYADDGLPLSTRPGSMFRITGGLAGEIPVAFCPGGVCPPGVTGPRVVPTAKGISAERIEQGTFLTVDRLTAMPDGGVLVTYSSPFMPDEVLTVNQQGQPELMTMDASSNLVPHPTRQAGVHANQILIIDRSIDLADLQDNPFPMAMYDELITLEATPEREVGIAEPRMVITGTPITEAAFERPLPASIAVATQTPAEQPVGLPTLTGELPAGWNAVVVGESMLILDNRGVIQEIIPVSRY